MSVSGDFATISINSIYVVRDERQRQEVGDTSDLEISITKSGLFHPPIIERDGRLRIGERRWTACKRLGWTHISVQYTDELDPAELELMELDENLARKNIDWKDECRAVAKYHDIRVKRDTDWTMVQTADALGRTAEFVRQRLGVAEALTDNRVAAAPKFSTARNIVARTTERKAQSAITGLISVANPKSEVLAPKQVPLINADFHEWAAAYTGPRSFNFIHCDFPYGVNADKHDQGQAAEQGGYEDSPDVYWKLIFTLNLAMNALVADSAHMMFWFAMDYYADTKRALEEMGWWVDPRPLVWVKSDGTSIAPDVNRRARYGYETAFMCSRGDRKIVKLKSNWFAHPGKDKSIHMSEKPVPMLKHFMELFVDDYSIVLDPTAGSANALKAATSLGASQVLGLERDEEFYNRAKEAYFNEH